MGQVDDVAVLSWEVHVLLRGADDAHVAREDGQDLAQAVEAEQRWLPLHLLLNEQCVGEDQAHRLVLYKESYL